MDKELTEQIKNIFPAQAGMIVGANGEEDPQDGHKIAVLKLRGTREELDEFYNVWDATDTGMHIITEETVSPRA